MINERDRTVPGAFGKRASESYVSIAEEWLREDGVAIGKTLPFQARAVLVAEAVNWAAKVINPEYYNIKPLVIDEVAGMPEVLSGWGEDDCFYLFHQEVGTASFHDPNGDIATQGSWDFPWSGVGRQEFVFDLLAEDWEKLWLIKEATTPWSPWQDNAAKEADFLGPDDCWLW